MGWTEVLVAFGSAIVGAILGWFGHDAWTQRTTGDNSPAIRTGGNSTVTAAGRDVVTMHSGPAPRAKLVAFKVGSGSMSAYHLRNDGDLPALDAVWGVEGDGTRVLSDVDPAIGSVSPGASFRLAYDATSFGSKAATLWVTWTNPDGSDDRFEVRI